MNDEQAQGCLQAELLKQLEGEMALGEATVETEGKLHVMPYGMAGPLQRQHTPTQ